MALQAYSMKQTYLHDLGAVFLELSERTSSMQSMLSALGDYWQEYYSSLPVLKQASSGFVSAVSTEYAKMLDFVLSADIIDIPDESRGQFDMLYFDMQDFIPMVRSAGGGFIPFTKNGEAVHIYDAESSEIDAIFVPFMDVKAIPYISTSLFESSVVLVEGVHYHVEEGRGIYFFVHIFSDTAIVPYTYAAGSEEKDSVETSAMFGTGVEDFHASSGRDRLRHKFIILWACGAVLSSSVMYERYGRFLYRRMADSEVYHYLVLSLMRYYTSAKTREAIEQAVNILCGAPYIRTDNERIVRMEYVDGAGNVIDSRDNAEKLIITTSANVYEAPSDASTFADDFVTPGSYYPKFTLLYRICTVEDYLSSPKWWERRLETGAYAIPDSSLSSVFTRGIFPREDTVDLITREDENAIIDSILKYNTYHITLNMADSAFARSPWLHADIDDLILTGTPIYLYPFLQKVITLFMSDGISEEAAVSDESLPITLSIPLADSFVWDVPDTEVIMPIMHSGMFRRNRSVRHFPVHTYVENGEDFLHAGTLTASDEEDASIAMDDSYAAFSVRAGMEDTAMADDTGGHITLYRWVRHNASYRALRNGKTFLHGPKAIPARI